MVPTRQKKAATLSVKNANLVFEIIKSSGFSEDAVLSRHGV
jgi:hypothetical protein